MIRRVDSSKSGFLTMPRRRKSQKQPPPEFVKELAEWLGRVMIAASQLEHTLGILLGDLLKLNRLQYGAVVIPMSTTSKTTLVNQLGAKYVAASDRKKLKSTLNEIKTCADIRNGLVHGFYGTKRGKFHLITHSGEGRLSGQPTAWTPTHLQALARRIGVANASAQQLRPLFPKRLSQPKCRQPIDASV
jgi:hypothetical protein